MQFSPTAPPGQAVRRDRLFKFIFLFYSSIPDRQENCKDKFIRISFYSRIHKDRNGNANYFRYCGHFSGQSQDGFVPADRRGARPCPAVQAAPPPALKKANLLKSAPAGSALSRCALAGHVPCAFQGRKQAHTHPAGRPMALGRRAGVTVRHGYRCRAHRFCGWILFAPRPGPGQFANIFGKALFGTKTAPAVNSAEVSCFSRFLRVLTNICAQKTSLDPKRRPKLYKVF